MTKFVQDVSALIYSFLETLFDEANARNISACLGLEEPEHGQRRSMLLETDFRGVLDDAVSGRDVLRVANTRDIGDPYAGVGAGEVNAVDTLWIRHVMAYERREGTSLNRDLMGIINEWVWRSDNWQTEPLRSARLEIQRPKTVTAALFGCMHHVVENHVYPSPWIFMTDLMTKMHAFDAMRQFEAAVVSALISTHVEVLTPELEDAVLRDLKQPLLFGTLESIPSGSATGVPEGALIDDDVTMDDPSAFDGDHPTVMFTLDEELRDLVDRDYLFPVASKEPIVDIDRAIGTVTPPHIRALFRTALANKDAVFAKHAA